MSVKKHLEKLIPLYLYGELSEDEKREFEVHLDYCEQCRGLLEQTRELHAKLDQKVTLTPSEETLQNSRLRLRERLQEEQRKATAHESWWQKIMERLTESNRVYQVAGAVAFLFIGIFLGQYVVPQPHTTLLQSASDVPLREAASFISNVDMIQYNPNTGEVTVRYKIVNDVALQGGIDNPEIRRVLVHAIRGENHPGQRLTAVKASSVGQIADAELEDALIYAMENDEVDGVRLRAAKVLKSLPISQDIKRAFIRVLLKEPNSAIRIEALDALDKVVEQDDVFPILRDASRDDENEFVRLKAAKALERIEPSQNEGRE